MKLNALTKVPHVRFDWTAGLLRDVARWANRRVWKYAPFAEYRRFYRRESAQALNMDLDFPEAEHRKA